MERIFSFRSLIILVVSVVVLSSLFMTTKTAASPVSIAKPNYIPSAVHNTAQYHSEQGKEAFQAEMGGYDSLDLMGPEHCDDGDEECLRRRMTSEAHLDYIYTQHHKP